MTGDFNPVAEQGSLERPSGILGRYRNRRALPPVGHGFERVYLNEDGHVVDRSGGATAGERYWDGTCGWVKVDMAGHELAFELPHYTADGQAGLLVIVRVTARISNAGEAVRQKVTSIRSCVETMLRVQLGSVVTGVAPNQGRSGSSPSPAAALRALESHAAEVASGALPTGSTLQHDGWLSVTVVSTTVTLDADTARFRERLADAERAAAVEQAVLRGSQGTATEQIALRKTWADYLRPNMSDPLTRAVEAVAADPSHENLVRVVRDLDASDQWTRVEVLGVLKQLIDKDFVSDVTELQAINTIVEQLQRGNTKPQRFQATCGTRPRH